MRYSNWRRQTKIKATLYDMERFYKAPYPMSQIVRAVESNPSKQAESLVNLFSTKTNLLWGYKFSNAYTPLDK